MNEDKAKKALLSKRKIKEESEEEESGESDAKPIKNKFANDGSFLEMFKQMEKANVSSVKQETSRDQSNSDLTTLESGSESRNVTTVKRRSKVLKIGVIKRNRRLLEDTEEMNSGDAWQQYMNEVRKYKDKFGDDSDKNRPLVK
ncbi:hypothetical protein B4U79_06075 [Dinothrombium tinctorium]|uniref:Uncharacterized protein n=1 Tax=Dinothrombium tinctorium TaxID=1965070 RepID=A0A3S3P4U9_9ACAR|nr:hypothetical protein B4U79_06075 [Dinothrombium tinctorium]